MPQKTYTVSENVRVEIRNCHNRVMVTGWDDARSILSDFAARQEGDTLFFENATKVTVRVPRTAAVTLIDCEADVRVEDLAGRVELANIGGDVALRNLRGETIVRDVDGDMSIKDVVALQGQGEWKGDVALRDVASCNINEIQGDASLRNVGAVTIQTIGGDASVMGGRDTLTIDEIEGDVNLREVNGRVVIQHCGDDVIASGVNGALELADVAGDAIVSFAQSVELKLYAKGDVVIRLPDSINADIELDAPHGDLIARNDIKILEEDDSHLRGTIGNGGVKIQAESTHGDLIVEGNRPMRHKHVSPMGEDFARMGQDFAQMGQDIANQVHESLRESLADLPKHVRARVAVRTHRPHHHHQHDDGPSIIEEPMEETPAKPAPSAEERQAILDAIGRGELSVDDAIKKLRGEA